MIWKKKNEIWKKFSTQNAYLVCLVCFCFVFGIFWFFLEHDLCYESNQIHTYTYTDQEESQSTPALLTATSSNVCNSSVSLGMIPEHTLESCARLSVSLEGPSLFTNRSHSSSSHSSHSSQLQHNMTLDELRAVNRYAESTKSLSYLPQVSPP